MANPALCVADGVSSLKTDTTTVGKRVFALVNREVRYAVGGWHFEDNRSINIDL